ncbi:MAG: hypothetical protein JNL09_08075, partial [Anaerolineales bacterium]|nr:hypothetical protein [Anaerolineales bacterium]
RHSRATRVQITLAFEPQQTRLEIIDNGHGFDLDSARKGVGLESMRERIERIGGSLAVESTANGTRIMARVERVED